MNDKKHALTISNLEYKLNSKDTLWKVPQAVLEENGTTLLLGRNGSGKSTLMRALLGRISCSKGYYIWHDDFLKPGAVGYVPELPVAAPGIKVEEWIGWFNNVKPEEVEARAPQHLTNPGLSLGSIKGRKLSTLSRGQLQIVQLWQALFAEPLALFLDEPFSGLDPWHKKSLVEVLNCINKQVTLLISTHEIPSKLQNELTKVWLIDNDSRELKSVSINELQI